MDQEETTQETDPPESKTPDPESYGLVWLFNAQHTPVSKQQYSTDENPRFSITELMLITALCYTMIVLTFNIGVVATVGLFIVFFVGGLIARKKVSNPAKLRFWNQLAWGILMPMACLLLLSAGLGDTSNRPHIAIPNEIFWCSAFVGFQMLVLAASWFVPPQHEFSNALVAGALFAGAVFAFILALWMTPIAILFGVILLGLPGFTPAFATYVLMQTSAMHRGRASDKVANDVALVCGFVVGWGALAGGPLLKLLVESSF